MELASQLNPSGLAGGPTGPNKLTFGQKFSKLNGNFDAAFNKGIGAQLGGIGGIASMASGAMDMIPLTTQADKGKNPTGYETQQAIGDALTKVPIPIVQAAGVAYKALSKVAEATGGNTNTITKDQAEDIGISKAGRLANNIIGAISPGAG
jgi:hypothetical protein